MKQVQSGPKFEFLCPQSLCGWPRSRSIPWPGYPKTSHGAKVAAVGPGGPGGGSHRRHRVLPAVSAALGIHGTWRFHGDAGHALLPVAVATGCIARGQEDAEYHGTQARFAVWIAGNTFIFDAKNLQQ